MEKNLVTCRTPPPLHVDFDSCSMQTAVCGLRRVLLAAVSQGGLGASVLMVEMDLVLSMGNSPLFHWTGDGSHCDHMAPPEIWVCTVETCMWHDQKRKALRVDFVWAGTILGQHGNQQPSNPTLSKKLLICTYLLIPLSRSVYLK